MKWLSLVFLLPVLPVGFLLFQSSAILGLKWSLVFIPLLVVFAPMVLLFIAISFVRVSRIYLQTAGGPVVLAFKIQLTDPATTLARFQTIKKAIEQAMGSASRT